MSRFTVALALLVLAGAWPLRAAELAIEYPALQRIVAQQLFTQDGRKYVRGSQADRCSFAYLENPRIDAENNHLRIRARFTGRSATDLFGAAASGSATPSTSPSPPCLTIAMAGSDFARSA